MKLIDVWQQVLRERGIPNSVLEFVRPKTDGALPTAAQVMRAEVPPERVEEARKMFEEIADKLFKKHNLFQ